MIVMSLIFMFVFVKSLAGNGNEDDFLAGVGDAKRRARRGITPLPCLLRLITEAPQRLLRAVGEVQALVASIIDDLCRPRGNEFVGRHRSIDVASTRKGRPDGSCLSRW